MAMPGVSIQLREPDFDWPEDTIYCEASCAKEEILYEGSEDEDYESPSERRQRYEEVGQRFLRGQPLNLLCTKLGGPFDAGSGWINPWRSKRRTIDRQTSSLPIQKKRSYQQTTVPKSQQMAALKSPKCHLPSPESLKQVDVEDSHPLLDDDELIKVQLWRQNVHPTTLEDALGASPTTTSLKKRRAKASEWLRDIPTKRRRTEQKNMISTQPSMPNHHSQPLPSHAAIPARDELIKSLVSPKSAPGDIEVTLDVKRCHSSHIHPNAPHRHLEGQDELAPTSFKSAPVRSNSPTKRNSPRRDFLKRAKLPDVDSDDELNSHIKALGGVSSPISQTAARPRQLDTALVQKSPAKPIHHAVDTQRSTAGQAERTDQTETFAPKGAEEDAWSIDTDMKDANEPFAADSAGQRFTNEHIPKDASSRAPNNQAHQSDYELASPEETAVDNLEDTTDIQTRLVIVQDANTTQAPPSHRLNTENCNMSSDISMPEVNDGAACDSDQDGSPRSPIPNLKTPPQEEITGVKDHICMLAENSRTASSANQQEFQAQNTAHILTDMAMEDSEKACNNLDQSHGNLEEGFCDGFHTKIADSEEASRVIASLTLERLTAEETHVPAKESNSFSLRSIFSSLVPTSSWTKLSQLTSRSALSSMKEEVGFGTEGEPPNQSTQKPLDSHIGGLGEMFLLEQKAPEAAESTQHLPVEARGGGGVIMEDPKPISISNPTSDEEREPPNDTANYGATIECQNVENPGGCVTPSQGHPIAKFDTLQASAINMQQSLDSETSGKCTTTLDTDVQIEAPEEEQQAGPGDEDVYRQANDEPSNTPVKLDSAFINESCNRVEPGNEPRLTTPEPQFSVKAFASFMSPSPERHRQMKRNLSQNGKRVCTPALPSAIRQMSSASRPTKCVSWAPCVDEQAAAQPQDDSVAVSSGVATETSRPASPPPAIPLDELPTSDNSKFHNHFTAVAKRSDGLRQRLLPTPSQLSSPMAHDQPVAMEALTSDNISTPNSAMEVVAGPFAKEGEARNVIDCSSSDPLDIVEDVFRDMSDFLQNWDVDTELNEARKTAPL